MEKRASVNIYKKGNIYIDYMLFEVNPIKRLSIKRIEISNESEFEEVFSNLLKKFKKAGVRRQKQFKWTAPVQRYDKTSKESQHVTQIAKKLVIDMCFRESKPGRKIIFIKGKEFINEVTQYFKSRGLISDKVNASGITPAKQRVLWEIGLDIVNKWQNKFSKEISKFEAWDKPR